MGIAPALTAAAVLVAAFVKGAIGFGFPTLATPLVALVVDVKSAVAILILPNIVMDALQALRQGSIGPTLRRFTVLLGFGALGTYVGTQLLVVLSVRTATAVLGTVVLVVAAINASRWAPRIPPTATRWLDPVAGTVAGIMGGLTNVPGTPLVLYFVALGLPKQDFVRAVAVTFLVYKLFQLGTVIWFGLLTPWLVAVSIVLTLVALVGFRMGLAIQDRLDQATFGRVTIGVLGALGAWLLVRALA